ncbi:MAG: sigma-54 dependent transcriptional regulator [Gammaproteobacteria bacterium]|nr:sigma-54 dependent transcriptional regulator [Gammaproteobacteria bacterium]MDH3379565.1 sigma-54 dependent transcriptional regulator [Gammaproteobacteria bacterium]
MVAPNRPALTEDHDVSKLLCLIEDDLIMGESLCDRFILEGFEIDWFKTAGEARAHVRPGRYALVISDIRLPDHTGEELFKELLEVHRTLPPFIFITGFGSIEKAVTLLQLGAADYITKPFEIDVLVEKTKTLAQRGPPVHPPDSESTLGISIAMRKIDASVPRLASRASTVLLTGESGVGKEHVAQRLHSSACGGQTQPFVAINCGAINESLLEAELFGHEKGAFTGAIKDRKGVFERASKGTLLLDEIGEMPLSMQVTLLRVLQDHRIVRVGGEEEIPIEVRILCATNKNLKAMVDQGEFREDLFYRINVVHIHIPPLRERREDILWFARQYVNEYNQEHSDKPKTLDRSAEQALVGHSWPGNLRELRFCIERGCIMNPGERLTASSLFADDDSELPEREEVGESTDETLRDYLSERERQYILQILGEHSWHIKESADALGISRKNLWEKMRKLNIQCASEEK